MEQSNGFDHDAGHPDFDWVEEFDDLTMDDLRELPHSVQLGMDLSIFD